MGTKYKPHNPFQSLRSAEVGQLVRLKGLFQQPQITKRNPAWAVVELVNHDRVLTSVLYPPLRSSTYDRPYKAYVDWRLVMPATKTIPDAVTVALVKYKMGLDTSVSTC